MTNTTTTTSNDGSNDVPNDKIVLAVIEGTTRVQRESIKAAKYVAGLAAQLPNVEVIFVDPNDFELPGDGNDPEGKDARYTAITERADAFFMVVPEYNHSFPGSLKRLVDSELANYNHKPVAFAGVSNGSWGGTRAVEALVPAVRETGLVVMSWDIYFPRVQDLFDDQHQMLAEHRARYDKNTAQLLEELLWFARLLKQGRRDRGV
jgi:NAD(P)H-dependent FMN reductase